MSIYICVLGPYVSMFVCPNIRVYDCLLVQGSVCLCALIIMFIDSVALFKKNIVDDLSCLKYCIFTKLSQIAIFCYINMSDVPDVMESSLI